MHSQNYKFTLVKPVSGLKQNVCSTFLRPGKSKLLAVILFCGLIFLGSVNAFAQIAAGATSSGFSTGSTTLTFSHTPGSGSNKLLLVAVGIGGINGTPAANDPQTVVSVTYNGNPLSQVEESIGNETRTYIYSLVNPGAGPNNIVVTISNDAGKDAISNTLVQASAVTFTGVHQVTPLGTPVKAESSTNSGSMTITVPSTTTTDVIYSVAGIDEGPTSNQDITMGSGQTSLWFDSHDSMTDRSSYKAGAAGSTTISYGFAFAQDHSGIAVAIKMAPPCTLPNCGSVTLTKIP
jgi:hypothetical protein